MFLFICSSLLIVSIQSIPILNTTSSSLPLLLVISFDGFRWDYPDIYDLPNFKSILKRGVRVKHIENSFATVTFPSHYTMVTGLFEETHGIVANTIYDPVLNDTAIVSTMTDTKWWSQNPYSQPIWISNQLANDSNQRRSGVIAWPGCGTPINGHRPYKYENYAAKRPFDSVLEQIFKWFHEPTDTNINFGVVYHSEPDVTGHRFGPISSEMNKTLHEIDNYVGQLLQIVDSDEYLKTHLNVIVTSDHGMHDVDKTRRIRLERYIDTSLFSAYGGNSFANIFVKNISDIDRIYQNLSVIPNYEVYKKSQIPDEYHYRSNVRIGDILIVGKVGYEIITPGIAETESLGNHGYDNRVESMHPIFYGFGPVFKSNLLAEPFRSVDLYPLMSYILHLNQRQTNGSFDNVKHILIGYQQDNFSKYLVIVCIISVTIIALIFTICAYRHSRQLVYVQSNQVPVEYHLLSNNEEAGSNFLVTDSEDEEINI
ncbi:unnamed protein product [Adineta steineri]|uniref:Uncharacterized protein n=1 Tax=Adineta steineri TaxID=433720 RepID=A0A818ME88_9BILA|nr:unnamed protein product [Adineta steineri]